MLVKNDFLNHWKTTLLRKRLGDGPALLALLSLWTYCEQRRAWQFSLNALELAGVCNFGGDPAELRHHLMELRFILEAGDGFWEVNGWGEANASLVAKWPGRRLTGDEYYHPQGFISKCANPAIPGPIPQPIAQAIPQPIGLAIARAIGLDRIGFDLNPPVAPQGGHDAAADSFTDSAGSTPSIRESEVPPGQKRKGGRGARLTEPMWPDDLPEAYREPLAKWFAYKREMGKGYTPTGWQTLVNQQRAFPAVQVARSVTASMAAQWSGLFTEKAVEAGHASAHVATVTRKPTNGVKSWAERKSEADQAQDDELAAIPRLPLDDHEPAWPWREISDKLYGHVWTDWRDVPEDNRKEMRAHFDKHPIKELQTA